MMHASQKNDDINYFETAEKQNYSIPTISKPNNHSQRIASTSSSRLSFNRPMILPPVGKEYICFMKEGKSDQAARCIKLRIMAKVIDHVLSIDTFEQKCVVLLGSVLTRYINVSNVFSHDKWYNN